MQIYLFSVILDFLRVILTPAASFDSQSHTFFSLPIASVALHQ
jgi:hypothetical protein